MHCECRVTHASLRSISIRCQWWGEDVRGPSCAPVVQKLESVARCCISMADLRHTPNEAVLVTKCLTVSSNANGAGAAADLLDDSDSDESEASTARSTQSARVAAAQAPPSPPPALPFAAVSRGFSSDRSLRLASAQLSTGSAGGAAADADAAGAGRSQQGPWATVADPVTGGGDDVGECGAPTEAEMDRAASARAHMPPSALGAGIGLVDGSAAARAHPLHNSACGSAMTGYGTLASDAKPPAGVQARGWLMFEGPPPPLHVPRM